MQRIEQVREFRKTSLQKAANAASATPSIFVSVRQTPDPYLLIPIVSSEKRDYVPMGYLGSDVICSNASFMLPNASLYHFSVLNSSMHNSWMRAVCGRLESRYRYSNTIVYNNFAWPSDLTDEAKEELEKTGQAILDARALHPNSSLASLYDPLTMPLELVKAHQANNKAVDKAYGYTGGDDDASRVAYLFKLYSKATSLLPVAAARRPRVRRAEPGTLI